MSVPTVSVILLNWQRPHSVHLTLAGLRQQRFEPFEIVVVGDRAHPPEGAEDVVWVQADEPNVAAARNLGIAAASGDILAFIDDDAVPEPGWLSQLVSALNRGADMA
ncbi:MAG: glycosyltransferase family A protein, partial [Pseudomonadota bacterium]